MNRAFITLAEFDRFETAAKATERRLLAENTWLRHHYGELESRVAQLKKDISSLKTAATKISKTLGLTAKPEPKTRSRT
jgi:hypothetical protein